MAYPSVFTLPRSPQADDGVRTPTLDEQRKTEAVLAEVLDTLLPAAVPSDLSIGGGTVLNKAEHAQWLSTLFFSLPAGYISLDTSKPWLMFWAVQTLDLLGYALDDETRARAVSTILACLSPQGGFAGGAANTQIPHLLPTYAAVCSLAITGGPESGWRELAAARQGIYDFFMRCKRPHGGFAVSDGGEIDVRGTYCLLVVATLLDLVTPELLHNVDVFLAGCQTYEGGFACSSYPVDQHRAGMAEAHGGYSSCAINSYFLLRSVTADGPLSSLGEGFPAPIDVKSALRWSALMQGDGCEMGGFRGRSNKLVDGCYSWWVGGGFPVLEELVRRDAPKKTAGGITEVDSDGDEVVPPSQTKHLFNRIALQEYVLLAAQHPKGGLRDKPGKRPDQYHTCNNLSGLSVAQHHMVHDAASIDGEFDGSKSLPAVVPTKAEGGWASEDERQRARKAAWTGVLGWAEKDEVVVGGPGSRVNATTPVVNVLGVRVAPFMRFFYGQK